LVGFPSESGAFPKVLASCAMAKQWMSQPWIWLVRTLKETASRYRIVTGRVERYYSGHQSLGHVRPSAFGWKVLKGTGNVIVHSSENRKSQKKGLGSKPPLSHRQSVTIAPAGETPIATVTVAMMRLSPGCGPAACVKRHTENKRNRRRECVQGVRV